MPGTSGWGFFRSCNTFFLFHPPPTTTTCTYYPPPQRVSSIAVCGKCWIWSLLATLACLLSTLFLLRDLLSAFLLFSSSFLICLVYIDPAPPVHSYASRHVSWRFGSVLSIFGSFTFMSPDVPPTFRRCTVASVTPQAWCIYEHLAVPFFTLQLAFIDMNQSVYFSTVNQHIITLLYVGKIWKVC